jgi:hypothetical protein
MEPSLAIVAGLHQARQPMISATAPQHPLGELIQLCRETMVAKIPEQILGFVGTLR